MILTRLSASTSPSQIPHVKRRSCVALFLAMATRKKKGKTTKKSKKTTKKGRGKAKTKRKGNPKNINKVLECDRALHDLIGVKKATRAQIIKKIWAYVKKNKLQDPKNGRFFYVDKKLAAVTGPERKKGDRMNGFKLAKHVKKHVT